MAKRLKKINFFSHYFWFVAIIVVTFFITTGIVLAAWQGPPAPPPDPNVPGYIWNVYGRTETQNNAVIHLVPPNSKIIAPQICLPNEANCKTSWPGEGYWTLNGSNLYPKQTTWNVGIGTTNPVAPLTVVGDTRSRTTIPALIEVAKALNDFSSGSAIAAATGLPQGGFSSVQEAVVGMVGDSSVYGALGRWSSAGFGSTVLAGYFRGNVAVENGNISIQRTSGNNAELSLKSVSAGDHWGIYHDRASDDLRFWHGDNRVILTDDGSLVVGRTVPSLSNYNFYTKVDSDTHSGAATQYAIYGEVETGTGVRTVYAVSGKGTSSGGADKVYALYGEASGSGTNYGVYGYARGDDPVVPSQRNNDIGVYGVSGISPNAANSRYAVFGVIPHQYTVKDVTGSIGRKITSGPQAGEWGVSGSAGQEVAQGVLGYWDQTSGLSYGVYGFAGGGNQDPDPNKTQGDGDIGVYGIAGVSPNAANSRYAVFGKIPDPQQRTAMDVTGFIGRKITSGPQAGEWGVAGSVRSGNAQGALGWYDENNLKAYGIYGFASGANNYAARFDGRVGIGTDQPGAKLHVQENAPQIRIGDAWGYWQFWAGSNLHVRKADTDLLFIRGDGNVGIGTTDPGNDKLDVRGRAYASGGWQTTNADYAEWFEKEADTNPGDIIGINLLTGKVRKYQPGDRFLGIHSLNPSVVGNRLKETDEEMEETHTLVSLLGQVDFDSSQVAIENNIVKTKDGKEVGVLLSNSKVLIGR